MAKILKMGVILPPAHPHKKVEDTHQKKLLPHSLLISLSFFLALEAVDTFINLRVSMKATKIPRALPADHISQAFRTCFLTQIALFFPFRVRHDFSPAMGLCERISGQTRRPLNYGYKQHPANDQGDSLP
ncbi:MAG TPA: hypothetical protein DD706_19105 [Nitrospiraceae bacterium]|nr:hypothetical protein [Nitrospiraceae bacterium]